MEMCDFSNNQRNGVYVHLYNRAVRTISSIWKTDIGITEDDLLDRATPCNGLLIDFACTGDFRKMLLELFCFTLMVMFNTVSYCVVILLSLVLN
jgi:hypothetical protein